jgi:DNA polymerase elongation subunit (family B)
MKNKKPRVLFYDIETSPNEMWSWSLRIPSGYLSHDNIKKERNIICGGWKWQGKQKVHTVAVKHTNPHDDRAVVKALREAVASADAVVHHNGDQFDMKWLRARILYHKLPPLPPVLQIDTKKIAKSHFYFNSNRLDYLARFLGIGCKIKTDFDLWKSVMSGVKAALAKMLAYNKHDVVLLEKVYNRLLPHAPVRLKRLYAEKESCQHCGGSEVQYRGYHYTIANKYKRYQCLGCGKWGHSAKAEK